jgi:glyoxylase-like metal-dependent hydrolase (beta-lactamase superfamily II)
MKLYVLDGGRAFVPDMSHFTPEKNVGVPVTIPFSMFLIDHPEGLVVFDPGLNIDNLPEAMRKELTYSSEQRIDRQMARLGYKPEDVKYVILSHMHADHTGGMTSFLNATFIVRKEELRMAWVARDLRRRLPSRRLQGYEGLQVSTTTGRRGDGRLL